MNILNLVRKNEVKYRQIMKELEEDFQKTGAKEVTELEWNSDEQILFYSISGPKGSVSRSYEKVNYSVYYKVAGKILG